MLNFKEILTATFHSHLLFEGRIEEIKDKFYKDIPQEDWDLILRSDPTTKKGNGGEYVKMGDNVKWIIKLYKKNKDKVLEDLPKLHNETNTGYLDVFTSKKQRLPVELRNIDKFESFADVYTMLRDNLGDEAFKTEKEVTANIQTEQTEKIEFKNWFMYIPKTGKAACYYANLWNTHWCTKNEDTARGYLEDGQLYIFEKKNSDPLVVYQLHIQSNQLADINDRMKSYDEVFNRDDLDVANYIFALEMKDFKPTQECYFDKENLIIKQELKYLHDNYYNSHRHTNDIKWAIGILTGEEDLDMYGDDYFPDIRNLPSLTAENLKRIKNYATKKYGKEEIKDLKESELLERMDEENDDPVMSSLKDSYSRANEQATIDAYVNRIQKQIESDFDGFIDWNDQTLTVKIPKSDVWKCISVIGSEESDMFNAYVNTLDNSEYSKIPNKLNLDNEYGDISDSDFNEQLAEQLTENGIPKDK